MAFTIEEIEQAFTSKNNRFNFYSFEFEIIRLTPNYHTVCDYLTGKTPTLRFIQADHSNY